jgi:hypothetical protein
MFKEYENFDEHGKAINGITVRTAGVRNPMPGDKMTGPKGPGLVIGYTAAATPEYPYVPVRYDSGHIVNVPYGDVEVTERVDETHLPIRYLHRDADLLFTWYGGTSAEVRRGDSHKIWRDYEVVDMSTRVGDESLVLTPLTWEALKERCDRWVAEEFRPV